VALTSIASESRRRRTHPSYPNTEATMRAVRPSSWHTRHTGAIIKGQRGETKGHAGVRRAPSRTRVPSSAGRRGGGRRPAPSGLWGNGARRALPRRRGRPKQQRRRRRRRPREAHAAAHLRIVPVDVASTLDQPPELRLVAVLCGLPHGLAHRVAHRVRRALQAFARSATCGFGGARAAPR